MWASIKYRRGGGGGGWGVGRASIKYQRGSKKNEESREAKKKCVKIPHYGGNMFVNVNMNNLKVKNHP